MRDGVVLAAAEEERFTRIKHGKRPIPFSTYELPFFAIDYCLEVAGVRARELDHVAYSFQPSLLLGKHSGEAWIRLPLEPSRHPVPEEWEAAWDPLFLSSIVNAPRHLLGGAPHHLKERFRGLALEGPPEWHFVPHHLSHAASAFHPSPFDRAAVMTLDGRGERATTSYFMGEGSRLTALGEVRLPHSLGLLYERVTEHLGFLHSSDEYKVMALASMGRPAFLDDFREIIRLGKEGIYEIAPVDLAERFGAARQRGAPLEARHLDLACSAQRAMEETVLEVCRWLSERTQSRKLCLAGGVALNCVMNGRLLRESSFDDIWVQPAAGDAGTALGAALWVDAAESGAMAGGRTRPYVMDHAYLGPSFSEEAIRAKLDEAKIRYRRMADPPGEVAKLLAEGRIIGWLEGRMEFGPRALGGRSILASPIPPDMQARLNELKEREDFRPVAPVVLAEEAENWFDEARRSPFMLFVFPVRPEKKDRVPAICHSDGSARIQTIERSQNPTYYDTIARFRDLTGVPILVNTSFNTKGRPVVCTPHDALECFFTSPLDALVMGPYLVEKS